MNRSYKIAFVNVDKNTTLCEMTGRDILRRREKKKARQTINLCSTGTIIESSLAVGAAVGAAVGEIVGAAVGVAVGAADGSAVAKVTMQHAAAASH